MYDQELADAELEDRQSAPNGNPTISTMLDQLGAASSYQANLLSLLTEKLGAITGPPPKRKESGLGVQPEPSPRSPVSERLYSAVSDYQRKNYQLEELLASLEL